MISGLIRTKVEVITFDQMCKKYTTRSTVLRWPLLHFLNILAVTNKTGRSYIILQMATELSRNHEVASKSSEEKNQQMWLSWKKNPLDPGPSFNLHPRFVIAVVFASSKSSQAAQTKQQKAANSTALMFAVSTLLIQSFVSIALTFDLNCNRYCFLQIIILYQ